MSSNAVTLSPEHTQLRAYRMQHHVAGQAAAHEADSAHERTRPAENAHPSDQTRWPGSVANPRRTRVR